MRTRLRRLRGWLGLLVATLGFLGLTSCYSDSVDVCPTCTPLCDPRIQLCDPGFDARVFFPDAGFVFDAGQPRLDGGQPPADATTD
ncbi:MAG: hypothetical protein IT370_07555 [Deltaproteobacteria bacterium]|nr:hypothetical protein [Deltaproteobacteria bacterium]